MKMLIYTKLKQPPCIMDRQINRTFVKQEAQGLGALLDKVQDNDHINWITQRSRCILHSKTCRFRDTKFLKI